MIHFLLYGQRNTIRISFVVSDIEAAGEADLLLKRGEKRFFPLELHRCRWRKRVFLSAMRKFVISWFNSREKHHFPPGTGNLSFSLR